MRNCRKHSFRGQPEDRHSEGCRDIFAAELFFEATHNSLEGSIYTAATETDSFLVSWEKVNPVGNTEFEINFQVELYFDGTIDIRWGTGAYPDSRSMNVHLEDSCSANYFYAGAYGDLFIADGSKYTGYEAESWPSNQCRRFVGGYQNNHID